MKIKKCFEAIMAVCAISVYPAVFLYCRNADEAGLIELIPGLLASLGIGLFVLFFISIISRSVEKAAFITIVFMVAFLNYTYVEKAVNILFPALRYWHIVTITLVVWLHLAYIIWRFLKNDIVETFTKVVGVVFGVLILVNILPSVPQMIRYVQAQSELKQLQEQNINLATDLDMPNVYLLIFDEYANFRQMEENYNYDNTVLKKFLEENQFNISYTSLNDSTASATVQTNMVNMDYIVNDETEESQKTLLRKDGELFRLMQKHGYTTKIYENGGFYGGSMPDGSHSTGSAVTMNGESMQDLLFQRTMVYPLYTTNDSQRIEQYKDIANYLSTHAGDNSGTFTLAYFCFPHQPFVVDENGRPLTAKAYNGDNVWENKSFYLGQYKYATKLMLLILEGIIKDDPKAIIMLMSDHGARAVEGATASLKKNTLNTLYYQGETVDIEGLSNVNTIRTVLNKLFNLDFEMVPVPGQ